MKIERLNDTQIKFVLNKTDLKNHNVNITDLAYGSEKTQELFQIMMNTAYEQYDFDTNNIPIMIEAIPVSKSSIMIIITKVKQPLDLNNILSTPSNSNNSITSSNTTILKNENSIQSIFSFKSIDTLIDMASIISNNILDIKNCLYKLDDTYYLVLFVSSKTKNLNSLDLIISEYGNRLITNHNIYVSYLSEHAEILINDNAVQRLSTI